MPGQLGTFQRLQVFQSLNRDWREHLSIVERDFLSYLIDASVSWGRNWIQVTVDQMLSGTEWGLPRVGLSRRSVFNALASLKEKGVIAVQQVSRKLNRYIVNIDWRPAVGLPIPKNKETPGAKKAGLAVSKNRVDSTVHDMHSTPDSECTKCTPNIDSKKPEKDSRRDAPDSLSGARAVEAVKARTKVKLYQSTDIEDVWKRAWIEGDFGAKPPGLSGRNTGQFKHVLRRFPNGLKIIEWGVANWSAVVARRFAWMERKAPPKHPEPGFMLRFIDAFAEDYASAEDTKHRWAQPAEDRHYQRLRAEGVSHEDALIEVGKLRASLDSQGKAAKDRAAAELERKALKIEREQLAQQRRNLKPVRSVEKPEPPTINHGDNPWENGGAAVADFSGLGEWSDDA